MRLRYQLELTQAIRNFFNKEGFIDVITPPIVENPGMEVHVHPYEVYSAKTKESKNLFLHTSPEFKLKKLLSDYKQERIENIFSISYCFRDEQNSPIHRNQFLMLEWYRVNEHYTKIMDDVESLITSTHKHLKTFGAPVKEITPKLERITCQNLIKKYTDIDILELLDKNELIKTIKTKLPKIHLPSIELEWDDYFYLIFLNYIEPNLKDYPALLIYEFPSPLAALSTLKAEDPRVCERFEVYLNGVELCNCFNELTDLKEQQARFDLQNQDKKRIYNYNLNEPSEFYSALEKGLPKSSGVALGVERLLYSLIDIENPFWD